MIKLNHIHKYFNKNRNNEIHVINDTTIEFPESGLVAITGPSGCGKTTLLNVIAGLDSFHSGEITYEGETIHKYKSSTIDKIRNNKIGFIFQNYNLIPYQTVYENIKTSLNIAGLYDKDKIEERINYSLEQVGMYNYRKRSVLALSGGQQQRVGIARAVSKNPDVILADEPTGNLDSNNTFEVMSLIKNISKTKLVILVTHEKNLVDLYADRIIELKDGSVVNDYQNFKNSTYEHKDDRYIYLKDLQNEDLQSQFIDYYYESDNKKHFNLKVVEMNNTIYIKAASDKKIAFIDDESEIHLIDDHKKEVKVDEMEPLDFDSFEPIDHLNRKSLFRWRDTLLNGLKKLFSRKKFTKKITIFVYFVISAVVAAQLASLGNLIKIDETQFLSAPKSFVGVDSEEKITTDDLRDIAGIEGVELPYLSYETMIFSSQTFYQTAVEAQTSGFAVKASWLDADDLMVGRMPENNQELVITSSVAKRLLANYSLSQMGYSSQGELMDFTVLMRSNSQHEMTVVGIIETNEELFVLADDSYPMFISNNLSYSSIDLYNNQIELVDGVNVSAVDEVIVNENTSLDVGDTLNLYSNTSSFINSFEVVGTFEFQGDASLHQVNYLITSEAFEDAMIVNMTSDSEISFEFYRDFKHSLHAEDKGAAIQAIEELGFEAIDIYEMDRDNYIENRTAQVSGQLVTLLVILGGIVLFIFFVMRTSMINRVKEIGIYRAIGASKKDVYKIFLSEILVYTTIASASGYLLSSYVLMGIERQVNTFFSVFYLPFWLLMLGLLGIYTVNIVFGLLPVFNLLRKTPAEILAKYDI
ncbi:ABC transporter ATP-binding protein/permease [Mycoplasmatota bacterium]|nr:ABC transporter ATP-binding protein/permease [Mycoplasmatota bacterium]